MEQDKINLKDNIWIEGSDVSPFTLSDNFPILQASRSIIFGGKTSNIKEKLARKIVSYHFSNECNIYYKDYSKLENILAFHLTAKDSLLSACNKKYCIIYKI